MTQIKPRHSRICLAEARQFCTAVMFKNTTGSALSLHSLKHQAHIISEYLRVHGDYACFKFCTVKLMKLLEGHEC